ncbi:hypothetical protein DICPUDRAFT_91967 [Dictyostelium purpureum]|uniref:Uncharacterized protein n=1 Tax=Dictyostelium purpureum TaxID=5786 RepID=F0ZJY2_DICPU|nr:uncharacterized protein DICPUDRAFT_91967 [Dictyostelium purpureum]EGC35760.1 hypothetical protein DICPUDRAFT_91967 [Dictyostelium purpureum]|eukprot:XP_003287712.1 hypothetical protein DICPUDRAFT_91967 [Dictyostelium purpureum]
MVQSPNQQQQPQTIPQQNVQSPIPQNINSPRVAQPIPQQQPNTITSPISTGTIVGNVTQSIAPPLPTSSLLSLNLISIENKAIQLQQLNRDIHQLVKLITPPNNNSNNNNKNNTSSQQPDLAEYNKNVQLLNQYQIKVQNIIKQIQQDLNNPNLQLYFLTPVLNDEHQQDSLFYDPYYPPTAEQLQQQQQQPKPIEIDSEQDPMQVETASTAPETLEQHNQRMFLEKFKRQLSPETINKQLQEWDSVFKDREKLNKNSDRVKISIFK